MAAKLLKVSTDVAAALLKDDSLLAVVMLEYVKEMFVLWVPAFYYKLYFGTPKPLTSAPTVFKAGQRVSR